MQEKLRDVEQNAAETGLHISTQNTKVHKANTKTLASLTVNHQPLEEVNSFIYLRSEVAIDGSSEGVVKRRIGKARSAFGMMSLKTKLRPFNSSIKNILLYGSETWKTTKNLLHKLQVFTNYCLRLILNIRWPDKIKNGSGFRWCRSTFGGGTLAGRTRPDKGWDGSKWAESTGLWGGWNLRDGWAMTMGCEEIQGWAQGWGLCEAGFWDMAGA